MSFTMLTKRVLGPRDYSIHENGQPVGRIRYTSEHVPGVWLWHVTVAIPDPPFGSAANYDEARAAFRTAWLAFKEKYGPEELAKAFDEMNHANRPDRYRW